MNVGEQSGAKRRAQIFTFGSGGMMCKSDVVYSSVEPDANFRIPRGIAVASIGADRDQPVPLQTAPVPGALTPKNALKSGHFSALGAGL